MNFGNLFRIIWQFCLIFSIKLLKYAVDNGILSNEGESSINILINDVIKNIKSINTLKALKQEVSNNGLDDYVEYYVNDTSQYSESLIKIGKEITPEQAKQEGILIDDLKRRVYEFDYNNATELASAAKDLINGCSKFLTDDKNIKQMVEVKMKEYLQMLMPKVLASKPSCISSSNKILLCDYHKNSTEKSNIRVVIDPMKIEINKKGNLLVYISIDFKLPVRGVNPKYNTNVSNKRNNGKNFEYITGKKIKIEIPL